jgi:anthranilate/para-aminobenzoate synthase component II
MPKKKKILVVDNYKSRNTRSIQQLRESVEKAGYDAEVIRYSDAKAKVDSGGDILEGYHGSVSSGSGRAWKKEGVKDKQGRDYLRNEDSVHDFLVRNDKPLYAICGAYHSVANSLGYRIKNTGKFNRGKDKDGHVYNHKYGLDANDIDSRLKNVETMKHAGQKYVKAFNYDNKRAVQYHPERTDVGRGELADFLGRYVKGYQRAA